MLVLKTWTTCPRVPLSKQFNSPVHTAVSIAILFTSCTLNGPDSNPLPANSCSLTIAPFTCRAFCGSLVLIPTPLVALIRKVFGVRDAKVGAPSDRTKVLACKASAYDPIATVLSPDVLLLLPAINEFAPFA